MILHRYSDRDGKYTWTRGKTDALRECRKTSKSTPNNITLEVQAVELKPLTGKTMLLALLNGEDVIAEDDQGDLKVTLLAEVKGRLKASKPRPLPKPVEAPANGTRPRKESPYVQESDDDAQEYVNVYTKHGCRLVKINHLRPGMIVHMNRTDGPVGQKLAGDW